MAIIKQHDKRSGITYAYESHSYWDPEKKMTRAKRKLIGRVDPETGEIIPTDGRNKKSKVSDSDNTDYKKLYEKLLKKYEAQEVLLASLKKQLKDLKTN
jgi:alpha-ketoglutarate-dependent taurine dioxygenase